MPARCRIAGTTSTRRSLPALCPKKDAPKEYGTKPRNNCFSQIFSPGKTPGTLHRTPAVSSSIALVFFWVFLNAACLSVVFTTRTEKEHHGKKYGPELYTPAD